MCFYEVENLISSEKFIDNHEYRGGIEVYFWGLTPDKLNLEGTRTKNS